MRVTVLMGGWSAERAVSLTSGKGVADAARAGGHAVTELDMGATPAAGADLAARLLATRPDIVFNALHGTPGEDGSVQGLLDLVGLPYTHSGVRASAIAIDKQLTKAILAPHGIRVPAGRLVASAELYAGDPLPRPYVVKPADEGSSVGVAIVTDADYPNPLTPDTAGPWQHFPTLMAEAFVPGLELTVAVLEDADGTPQALGVTELRPKSGFYDYRAKYTDGMTVHICPAEIPGDLRAAACDAALNAHRILGLGGLSRSDFRYDPAQGADGLYFLEVNTQPGMTPLSLVPEQAKAAGMSYPDLVDRVLARGLAAHKSREAPR